MNLVMRSSEDLAVLATFLVACGQAFSAGPVVGSPADAQAEVLGTTPEAGADAGGDVGAAEGGACLARGQLCSPGRPCCGADECSYVPGPSANVCHSSLCCYSNASFSGPFPCDTTQDPNGSPTPGGFQVQCDANAGTCSMVGVESPVLAGVGVVMPCSAPEAGAPPTCSPFDGGMFRGALACCGQGICVCNGCTDENPTCTCPNGCKTDLGTGDVGCE